MIAVKSTFQKLIYSEKMERKDVIFSRKQIGILMIGFLYTNVIEIPASKLLVKMSEVILDAAQK